MPQFIGYQIDQTGTEAVPVATGTDRMETQSLMIRRTLAAGCVEGSMQVQQRDDVPADVFEQLGKHLDKFFAERGLE